MINKLLPDQISSLWPVIKYAVEQSLPPITGEHPDKINRILSSMLSGGLDVWASYDQESKKFEAILVTHVLEDQPSNTRSLLLYCLYGYSMITKDRWEEGFSSMVKYARSKRCTKIVAYTDNKHLIEIASACGATTTTFISIDLDRLNFEQIGG